MTRTYLELKDGKFKEVSSSDFWIDTALYNKLLSLKKIQRDKWDGVLLVDGKERSGKSTLAMVMGWILSNGTLTENNFARSIEDASNKIESLPDGTVLIVDEGSLLFSSKDSMGAGQKQLIKILDVVGQKNMIFIIVLPCFFDLNKTIAVRRSLFLLHVYTGDDYRRGRYAYFGENTKRKLYFHGKKNYDSYEWPRAEFVGEYLDFKPPFYDSYIKKVKELTLKELLAMRPKVKEPKPEISEFVRNIDLMDRLRLYCKRITYRELGLVFGISENTVAGYFKKLEKGEDIVTNKGIYSKKTPVSSLLEAESI